MFIRLMILLVLLAVTSRAGWADLAPNEIAILAAADSRGSVALANYYAKQRQIPVSQICSISMPPAKNETLSRAAWRDKVRPAIRAWLAENQLEDKVRCFVTVWDVPLRIGRDQPGNLESRQRFFSAEHARRLAALSEIADRAAALARTVTGKELDSAAAASSNPNNAAGDAADDAANDSELNRITQRLQPMLEEIRRGIQAESDPIKRQNFSRTLQQLIARAAGLSTFYDGLSRSMQNQQAVTPQLTAEFHAMRGRILGLNEGRALVESQQLPGLQREQTSLLFTERVGGLIQSIRWIDEQLQTVDKNETQASFDSELSLILWPDYELLRWQNNFLHRRFDGSGLRNAHPTLMVSRLDAPTIELAKGLIDKALEAEANGLHGKVYLDARGLAELDNQPVATGSHAAYDRSLLATAAALKTNGRLEVVLDTNAELFQPGTSPDAAIYCGWYSLAKYVDAFDWQPGAVAYHLASFEATTLKSADSEAWCKRLIEDGVCATIGPVAEPYLQSFPPPSDFLPLFMSGKYSLAECYYLTKPYNSWMMTLIGDPLYNPFKNDPAYTGDVGAD